MAIGSKTARPYRKPPSSQRAVAGLKPLSSVSMPMVSDPPRFGLAVEIPLRPGPLVVLAPAIPSLNRPHGGAGPECQPPGQESPPVKRLRHRNPPKGLDPYPTTTSAARVRRQVTT